VALGLLALLVAGACSGQVITGPDAPGADGAEVGDAPDDGTQSGDKGFSVALSGLPPALLSVWGLAHDDLWITGADTGDGTGPWVVRGTAEGFWRFDLRSVDPSGGHIWWAHGPDEATVFLVGEGGRAFRYSRASDQVIAIATGTDATLYGVWGASADEVWAVGGYVHPRSGPATVVRITPFGPEVQNLPEGIADNVTLFKVWGSAADDVWVIGERGTVLRWDGSRWSYQPVDGRPRLVTLHGAGADDMVAVGGSNQAVILERAGGAWTAASPGPYPLLNGVFVAPGGDALAVGVLGSVFRRTSGAWAPISEVPVFKDWHAVWVDPRGDAWLVGGNLLSAAAFNEGALLRLGPSRDDVPAGAVSGFDAPVADPGPEAPDVVEAEPPAAEPTADVVEPPPDVEVVEVVDGDALDADEQGDGADADAGDVEPPEIELGSVVDYIHFTPLTPGQDVPIVPGPQGGVHVDVAIRFRHESSAEYLETRIMVEAFIEDDRVATFGILAYPTPRLQEGVFQTYNLPVMFCLEWDEWNPDQCTFSADHEDAVLFDGQTLRIHAEIAFSGGEVVLEASETVTPRQIEVPSPP